MFESVLIVEDDQASLYYLRSLLEAKGSRIQTATNGEEALSKARINPPQLVISDLLMPVMDGFSLLSEWVEDPRLNRIPFVVYTGTFTTEEDRQLALHLGADAFLVKPMEPQELLESLEKAVADFTPDRFIATEKKLDFARRHADILVRKLTQRNRELERERIARNREVLEKEALLDAVEANIAVLDPRGRILRVNEAWRRFARENEFASATYGVGGNYLDTVQGPDQSAIRDSIEAVLKGELPSFFTDYPCHSKHQKLWFRMVVTPLKSSDSGAIVMHVDISKRKLLEEQLLRAQRLETIGALAGGVAHDLNNSLAPITVAVELMKAGVHDETQLELLSSIEKSANRGRDLVRQLLLFARGEEGERHPVSLLEPLNEVYRVAQDTFPERIKLKCDISVGEAMVQADQTQLYQVFLNLCLNARDAIEGEGAIEIRAVLAKPGDLPLGSEISQDIDYVRIEVQDTGHGIAQENIERVFEPFFTTKEPGQGTGLGLSTAKSIIDSHRGQFEIESELGRGTTFRVYLPVCAIQAAGTPEEVSRRPAAENKTVMVVDDEATIRELVLRILEAGGYRAVGAGNGLEALSIFRKAPESFDAVLTDLTMPGMTGVELVTQMRLTRPDLKVVVCSGMDPLSKGLKSLNQPYSFLQKPFTGRELLAAFDQDKPQPSRSGVGASSTGR